MELSEHTLKQINKCIEVVDEMEITSHDMTEQYYKSIYDKQYDIECTLKHIVDLIKTSMRDEGLMESWNVIKYEIMQAVGNTVKLKNSIFKNSDYKVFIACENLEHLLSFAYTVADGYIYVKRREFQIKDLESPLTMLLKIADSHYIESIDSHDVCIELRDGTYCFLSNKSQGENYIINKNFSIPLLKEYDCELNHSSGLGDPHKHDIIAVYKYKNAFAYCLDDNSALKYADMETIMKRQNGLWHGDGFSYGKVWNGHEWSYI